MVTVNKYQQCYSIPMMVFGFAMLITIFTSESLALPQDISTRFSDKTATITGGNNGYSADNGLGSRFGSGDGAKPPGSIGYYPYGSGTVPFLIRNPYPEISPYPYGYKAPVTTNNQNNIGSPLQTAGYQNGGFGQGIHKSYPHYKRNY